MHFDYVNGCAWIEVEDHLPVLKNNFSPTPYLVESSDLCLVVTSTGIKQAVYTCLTDRRNGKTSKGWVEKPEYFANLDFLYFVLDYKEIDVIRWHYSITPPEKCNNENQQQ